MKDTSEEIKKIQLKIWLAKPPAERLLLAIRDNEDMFAFWEQGKLELARNNPKQFPSS